MPCSIIFAAILAATISPARAAEPAPAAETAKPGDGFYDPALAFSNVVFVAFDTETTGFSPKTGRLVQLGVVKFRGERVLEKRTWLVNPGMWIPNAAREVHGISNETVAGQPAFREILPAFTNFIAGAVLIAHNAPFDIGFLRAEFLRAHARRPENPVVNSLPLFRTWYPELKSHSISKLAEHLHLDDAAFHTADGDAMYIVRILNAHGRAAPGPMTLGDLYRDSGGPLSFAPPPAAAAPEGTTAPAAGSGAVAEDPGQGPVVNRHDPAQVRVEQPQADDRQEHLERRPAQP